MHVEYTMHKSNNFSFTNMVYYRMYKKVDPLECFLIRSNQYMRRNT